MKTSFIPLLATLAIALPGGAVFAEPTPAPAAASTPAAMPSVSVSTSGISVKILSGTNGAVSIKMSTDSPAISTREKQKVTFLGISVAQLPDAVSAQLPLDKGTGLLVLHVTRDSAAAKAGLEENDVIAKFDTQILINPEQLMTLIKNKKEGDTVRLDFFRKGREQTVAATLLAGEAMPAQNSFSIDPVNVSQLIQDAMEQGKRMAEQNPKEAAEFAKIAAGIVQNSGTGGNASGAGSGSNSQNYSGLLQGILKNVSLKNVSIQAATKIENMETSEASQSDASGTISISKKDGHVHLYAADKDHKVIFDGDIDAPELEAKVPADIMAKARALMEDLKKAPVRNDANPH